MSPGKRLNLGDKKGMQDPCELQFVGKDKRIFVLKKENLPYKSDFEHTKKKLYRVS